LAASNTLTVLVKLRPGAWFLAGNHHAWSIREAPHHVGWKGLIHDPASRSFQIVQGLRIARKVLLDINNPRPAGGLLFWT